jgi:hypothetical protein
MALNKSNNRCDEPCIQQVRKIGPTRRSVSGVLAFRGATSVPFESTLERDFLRRCESNISVLDVIAQPVAIPFQGQNGQTYFYTPDYLLYYRLGSHSYMDYPKPLLVEVKPKEQWKKHWRTWLPKWKAARRYAKEQGWRFQIWDESRIRDQVLTNIQFLERYQRMSFSTEEIQHVLETLCQVGSCSVDYLLARHFMGIYRAQGLSLIWHLLSTRRIDCDLSRPLGQETELWVVEYE